MLWSKESTSSSELRVQHLSLTHISALYDGISPVIVSANVPTRHTVSFHPFTDVFFLSFFHRNLGKSGLRVSCLGLGELVWMQENIHLTFNPWNKTNVCVSPPVQAPGWHLDHRSLMRWELHRHSVCARSRFPTPSLILLLWKNTVKADLSVFNYRNVWNPTDLIPRK